MANLHFKSLIASAAALAALALAGSVAGCGGIPQDGRYQTHDGGRSNNRAEAPASSPAIRF